jgi:hypothetical protein
VIESRARTDLNRSESGQESPSSRQQPALKTATQQDEMWLLNTSTLELCSFADGNVPYYIILSHTWGSEEVSFQDIQSPDAGTINKAGYGKVKKCCAEAAANGFQYAWIDTCCIDKTNSTELSEAINSMFRWYRDATECYAYLEDVKPCEENYGFANSRWFTRGWTLQELIAPSNVLFFDHYWNEIGSRASLSRTIERLTRIPFAVLMGESLEKYSVAQIMSWAAGRETTKIEDRAYALLGLFGVFMPMIYGEGEMAFRRLQLEIMKTKTDHSLFVWRAKGFDTGPLARSPDEFARCGNIRHHADNKEIAFEMTNLGLRITLPITGRILALGGHHRFAYLSCDEDVPDPGCEKLPIGIWLSEVEKDGKPTGQYFRTQSTEIYINHAHAKQVPKSTPLYIIDRDIHNLNRPDMRRRQFNALSCLFDYESLHNEEYILEGKSIWSEGQNSIWLFENFRIRAELGITWPWVLFFRHKERTERFWVALSMVNGRIWSAIETNVSDSDTPYSILKYQPPLLADRRHDRWGVFDRVSKVLPSGRILKLVIKRGMVSGRLGFLANISVGDEKQNVYGTQDWALSAAV